MAIPPKEQMTGNNTTEAQFKSGMNGIVDYLGEVEGNAQLKADAAKKAAVEESSVYTNTQNQLTTYEQTSAEFYNDDRERLETPIIVSNDQVLLSLNQYGKLKDNIDHEFYNQPTSQSEEGFSFRDTEGNALINNPIHSEFHNDDTTLSKEFFETDMHGNIIDSGSGVDVEKLKEKEVDAHTGNLFKENQQLKISRDFTTFLYNDDHKYGHFETSAKVYELLDLLVTRNQDYIKKTLLGEDDFGNSIFAYEFNSPGLAKGYNSSVPSWDTPSTKPPKILIQSGVHGNERDGVISTIITMHELAENWKKSEDLTALRFMTDIVFIPIINPSGFDLNTRENGNKVDINRNSSSDIKEKETVISISLPAKYGAGFFIDSHNSYRFGETRYPFWVGTEDEKLVPMLRELALSQSAFLKKSINTSDPLYAESVPTGRVTKNPSTSIVAAWYLQNVHSILLETPRQGGTSITLRERRIHNSICVIKTLISVRKYLILKEQLSA